MVWGLVGGVEVERGAFGDGEGDVGDGYQDFSAC